MNDASTTHNNHHIRDTHPNQLAGIQNAYYITKSQDSRYSLVTLTRIGHYSKYHYQETWNYIHGYIPCIRSPLPNTAGSTFSHELGSSHILARGHRWYRAASYVLNKGGTHLVVWPRWCRSTRADNERSGLQFGGTLRHKKPNIASTPYRDMNARLPRVNSLVMPRILCGTLALPHLTPFIPARMRTCLGVKILMVSPFN